MEIIKNIKYRCAFKEYKKSIKNSEDALNDISFKDGKTPLYFSSRRYELLLNTFNIRPKISSTHENSKSKLGKMSLETSLVDIKLESTPTPKITEYYGEDTKISIIKNNLEKIKKDGDKITEVNS